MVPENLPAPPPYSGSGVCRYWRLGEGLAEVAGCSPSEPSYRGTATERPEETLTYHFDLNPTTNTASVPFPTRWLVRDVDIKDWVTILSCLPEQHGGVTKTGEFERYVDEIAWRRKITHVVEEWNKNFFGPRCLHVVPDLSVGTNAKGSQGTGSTGR
jgi:hypothetical protein